MTNKPIVIEVARANKGLRRLNKKLAHRDQRITQLKQQIEWLAGLLLLAICPNPDCDGKEIIIGQDYAGICKWCKDCAGIAKELQ